MYSSAFRTLSYSRCSQKNSANALRRTKKRCRRVTSRAVIPSRRAEKGAFRRGSTAGARAAVAGLKPAHHSATEANSDGAMMRRGREWDEGERRSGQRGTISPHALAQAARSASATSTTSETTRHKDQVECTFEKSARRSGTVRRRGPWERLSAVESSNRSSHPCLGATDAKISDRKPGRHGPSKPAAGRALTTPNSREEPEREKVAQASVEMFTYI